MGGRRKELSEHWKIIFILSDLFAYYNDEPKDAWEFDAESIERIVSNWHIKMEGIFDSSIIDRSYFLFIAKIVCIGFVN